VCTPLLGVVDYSYETTTTTPIVATSASATTCSIIIDVEITNVKIVISRGMDNEEGTQSISLTRHA
jgi:hypothetical protein